MERSFKEYTGYETINMLMSNIIQFPTKLTGPVKQVDSTFYENEIAKNLIEDFIDKIGHELVNQMHHNGYDVDNDGFIIRYMFAMELLKSTLYYSKDLDHKLSDYAGRIAQEYFAEEATNNE